MEALPLLAGGVHDTVAWESPACAVAPVGAPGTVMATGVTLLLGAENALVP